MAYFFTDVIVQYIYVLNFRAEEQTEIMIGNQFLREDSFLRVLHWKWNDNEIE